MYFMETSLMKRCRSCASRALCATGELSDVLVRQTQPSSNNYGQLRQLQKIGWRYWLLFLHIPGFRPGQE